MSQIDCPAFFSLLKSCSSDEDKVDLSFFTEDLVSYVSIIYHHDYESFDVTQVSDVVMLVTRLSEIGLHIVSVYTSDSYISVKCWL